MSDEFVNVSVSTWSRDSHGLYDYDSKEVGTVIKVVHKNCMIVSTHGEISI
jgi:hypothetical protein